MESLSSNQELRTPEGVIQVIIYSYLLHEFLRAIIGG
jgi:hypothetical protein